MLSESVLNVKSADEGPGLTRREKCSLSDLKARIKIHSVATTDSRIASRGGGRNS